MQRLLISLATSAVIGLGSGGGVWAASYPPDAALLTLTPSAIAPGGTVSGVFTGCALGETVAFTLAGSTMSSSCAGGGGGAARGLTTPSPGTATVTLTAPSTAGKYTVSGTGATSGVTASATLTVVAPSALIHTGSLPSTGADGERTLWIAGTALLIGLWLVIIAWHRRPAYSPLTPSAGHSRLFGTRHVSAYERQVRTRERLVLPERLSMTPVDSRYFGWRRHAKRAMDIGLVVLTFPITLPLVGMIAVGVKLTSRGPVFFHHRRVGRHGEVFTMLKFRTMYVDALQRLRADPELYATYLRNDFKLPAKEDPRIVPFGRFLRRWSLDEVPQLFNVLQGRMSLVGPRPIVDGELECYGPWSWAYLDAKPGITGRWQTTGRSFVHYPERAQLDADYVEHWTLHGDVAILVKTIPAVLRREGSD